MMRVFSFSKAVSVASAMLALSLVLSACGTAGRGKILPSIGNTPSAKPETSLLTSLGNGLLGNAATQLAASDRRKALEAEYRALEYSPNGKAVSWSSGSNSGEVTAAQPYQVGSQNCRQYSHSYDIGGTSQTTRGTACRNADGSWTPLT
ncbi:hypothetical protein AAIB41_01810 [Brucella sp. BE17]|uniref:hypothetical protein n=1 Tax=Brucella sp. BE17 TaxID=3142977 RepID=UPI0031B9EAED